MTSVTPLLWEVFETGWGGGNEEGNHILGFFGIGVRWKHFDKQTPEHVLPTFKGISSLPRSLGGINPEFFGLFHLIVFSLKFRFFSTTTCCGQVFSPSSLTCDRFGTFNQNSYFLFLSTFPLQKSFEVLPHI